MSCIDIAESLRNFQFQSTAKLPKWFGERPGKKAGDPETPEGEDEVKPEDEEVEEVEEVVEEVVSIILC